MPRIFLRLIVPVLIVGGTVIVLRPLLAQPSSTSASWSEEPASAPPSGHAVVVAELFTSEGCSSCPPADTVLSTLIHDQPLPSIEVVGLSEHVDYWDRLGWRNPFSSSAFSARQSDYSARVFRSGDIYTPQLVVDGQYQVVGSDIRGVRAAIVRAAGVPKVIVDVETAPSSPDNVNVRVRLRAAPNVPLQSRSDLVVALVQDHVMDDVLRGENRGHRLTHSAVVRQLTAIASTPALASDVTAQTTLPISKLWNLPEMRVVAFLQERNSRRILGAGTTTLDHLPLKEHTR